MAREVVFDIETDGLLPELTKVHCIAAKDVNTGETWSWRPWEVEEGVKFLAECDLLIAHNGIDFDCRAIEKVYPWWRRPKVRDTLVMAKMLWPYDALLGRDLKLIAQGRFPGKYLKRHSLAAWGYRLGNLKGEYDGGWAAWSESMHAYMEQDVAVNADLYALILKRIGWKDAPEGTYVWPELPFEIEHEVATIIVEQEREGFPFDREAAIRLSQDLMNHRAELEAKLVETFGSWWAPLDDIRTGTLPKKDQERKVTSSPDVTRPRWGVRGQRLKDYVGPPIETISQDAPFVRIKRVTFSASSRDHLGQRLRQVYGWKPTKFGKNGKPTVDEDTLSEISEDVLPADLRKTLVDFFTVDKTIGQLSAGNKSWLRFVTPEGRLHGRMDTCGAVTSRGTHRDPNIGQVPSVEVEETKAADGSKSKRVLKGLAGGFGWECRSLFVAPHGREMTGTDASSLELLCLGHYLAPLDEGAFRDRVSDPSRDPHSEHSELTGLARAPTKTVTYAYVYGAGALKVGLSLGLADDEMPTLLRYPSLRHMLQWQKRMAGPQWEEPDDRTKARMAKGHQVIKAFEGGIPGIKDLKDGVKAAAEERGWVKALDGRLLTVRKAHAALNTLLQGAGAIICKLWMVLLHRKLKAAGIDATQVAWIHDELQFHHAPGLGDEIGRLSRDAIREAGEMLGFRGVLRSDFKTGLSWAETH